MSGAIGEAEMPESPSITPDVLTTIVWDAIKSIPGVVELHRNPIQALTERVGAERRGPVRLVEQENAPPTLELHLVLAFGVRLPVVAEEVRHTLARFLPAAVGLTDVHVRVVVDDLAESVPPPPP